MFATIQRPTVAMPPIMTGTLGRNKQGLEGLKSHAARLQRNFDKARSQPNWGIPSPTSPTQPRSHSDPHMQYKLKNIASTQKLARFFGSAPPADLGLKEIEREGLKAMLRSKVPLCYFLASLISEFSHESLVSLPLFFSLLILTEKVLLSRSRKVRSYPTYRDFNIT